MKNKLICKILIMIMLVLFTISTLNVNVYAEGSSNFDFSEYENATATSSIKNPVNSVVGTILGVVRIIFVAIAMIMLMILAIKYLTSSPSERAEIKKSAIQYVVGAVVLFAATGILTVIGNFITSALPTS